MFSYTLQISHFAPDYNSKNVIQVQQNLENIVRSLGFEKHFSWLPSTHTDFYSMYFHFIFTQSQKIEEKKYLHFLGVLESTINI
jgi:hypothetical protein